MEIQSREHRSTARLAFRPTAVACGVVVAVLLITTTRAAFVPVPSRKLVVVDKRTAASKAKVAYVAKDSAITKGFGVNIDFIGVDVYLSYAEGSTSGAFTIPSGASFGWLVNKDKIAKYVNKSAPSGPTETKVVVIKPGKVLKMVGKGLGDDPFDILSGNAPEGSVTTALCVQNGGETNCHCSEFPTCTWKSIAGGTGAKLVCKGALGDPSCTAICSDLVDQGDTVLDVCTGLEWEKKETVVGSGVDAGNRHDVDNRYSWAGECSVSNALCQPNLEAAAACAAHTSGATGCDECAGMDGFCDVDPDGAGAITTIWDWLAQLNGASFAGHSDWRLPTSRGFGGSQTGQAGELESIFDVGEGMCAGLTDACIDPIFGPTVSGGAEFYWSASEFFVSNFAFGFSFSAGPGGGGKTEALWVRAVRSAQ